jgi:hypothetical protein
MIATLQPKRIVTQLWQDRHLYLVRGDGRRRVYVGSVVCNTFMQRWAAWRRGAFMGNFTSEANARAALEEYANEQGKSYQSYQSYKSS